MVRPLQKYIDRLIALVSSGKPKLNDMISHRVALASHRLLQLAKEQGRQDQLMERLHRAYFTDQESIFDHESLTRLATAAGLDRDEVAGVLASDRYAEHVDTDEQMAQVLGATGVPLFV